MKNHAIRRRFFALTALACLLGMAYCLSGCAGVSVAMHRKPFQGDLVMQDDANGPRKIVHRRLEAVKQGRLFWGLLNVAASPPTAYDLYRRLRWQDGWWLAMLFMTEMSCDEFFIVHPLPNETREEALKRVGIAPKDLQGNPVAMDDGNIDFKYLEKLRSDASPMARMFFRLITLGIFWDAGYSTDGEVWGLQNKAYAWSWFGRSDMIITVDEYGNFYVHEALFDPSRTVKLAGELAGQSALLMSMLNSAEPLFQARAADTQTTSNQRLVLAYQDEAKKLQTSQAEIKTLNEQNQAKTQEMDEMRAQARLMLQSALRQRAAIQKALGPGEALTNGKILESACIEISNAEAEAFNPSTAK